MVARKNKGKKIKKDYQAKDLANPFFRKKEKKKQKSSFLWLKLLAILFSTSLLIWFLFIFSYWNIINIDVVNFERVNRNKIEEKILQQMDKKALLFFSQKNIFIFKSSSLIDDLKEEFNLSDLKIKKKLPNKLLIDVIEKPYAYIYSENDNYYFASSDNYLISGLKFVSSEDKPLDDLNQADAAKELNLPADEIIEEGSINEIDLVKVNPEEKSKYIIIENKNKNSLIQNKEKVALKNNYLSFIFDLSKELKNYPEFEVDKFIIVDQYFKSIFVKINNGPQIYFNVNLGINDQLDKLFVIKNNKIKDNFKLLEYIDLRYGNKVYFFPENVIN